MAFIGVSLTILFSERRARQERRDSFLREQRELCSELLGSAYRYTKAVVAFSDYAYWTSSGEERARAEFDELQTAQLEFHAQLLRFRLVVEPPELVEACDSLYEAYTRTYEQAGHVIDAFWAFGEIPNSWLHPRASRLVGQEKGRTAREQQAKATNVVHELQEQAANFHQVARRVLAPSISSVAEEETS